MPQERYNTEWLREKNLGIVLTSFSNISEGVHRLLQQPTLQNLRENAQAYRNRALFEIPAILDEVLERHVAHKVPIVPSITTPSHRIERDAAWASLTE
jgi:L-lactate utilization protein LutB